MRSTGRPRSPPLALTSSRQIWSASSALLPPPDKPPVNDIDKPILIGSAAWARGPMSSAAHSASTQAIVERNDLIGRFLPFVRSGYINSPARLRATAICLIVGSKPRHGPPRLDLKQQGSTL